MKKLLFTLLLAAMVLPSWADEVYMTIIGGATSVGWMGDSSEAETRVFKRSVGRMVRTADNTWVWVGKLTTTNDGQFKITNGTDKDYWYGYGAQSDNSSDTNVDCNAGNDYTVNLTLSTNNAENDHKFVVTNDGMYRITVNLSPTPKTIKVELLTEPTKDGDYYLLGTVDAFMWFAGYVTSENSNAKARLTADISFNGENVNFFPIGSEFHKFKGEFDGAGCTIDYAIINDPRDDVGFFRYISAGANIHDLIIGSNSRFTGSNNVGGIAGKATESGTVTINKVINCATIHAENTVSGTNVAGFVAFADGATINATNCGNLGLTSTGGYDAKSSAFIGWISVPASFTNCWNGGTICDMNGTDNLYRTNQTITVDNCYDVSGGSCGQGLQLGTPAKTSGELCYKLGHGTTPATWTQTIGTDSHPIPFNTRQTVNEVVANVSYSNLSVSSNKVLIASGANLAQFAKEVNAGNASMDALLTAEIDMNGVGYTPIGTSTYKYAGTFDGGSNRIKNLTISSEEKAQLGLFSYCASATIQNLIMDSSCAVTSTYSPSDQNIGWGNAAFVAICAGDNSNLTFRNCGNEASVTGARGNNAAFVGKKEDSGSGTISFTNCYNTGNISGGGYNAAFIGDNAGKVYTTKNCYNSGTINRSDDNTDKWVHSAGEGSTVTNCYTTTRDNGAGEGLTERIDDIITSGKLCIDLKGDNVTNPFTQDLSTASHPTFGSKEVHIANWFDSGSWDIYYNEEGSTRTAYILNLNDTKTRFGLDPNFTLTAKNVKMKTTLNSLTSDTYQYRWNTFCSPVALPKDGNFSAVKELTGVSVTGDHYTMEFSDIVGDNLEAGKPYMVQVASSSPEFTATDAIVAKAASSSETYNGLTFNGTFTSRTAPVSDASNSYFIISNNNFYKVDSDVTLKAFRGYITVAGAGEVKALTFDFDDDPTAIEMVNGQSSMVNDNEIYNLAGQRINKMQKGINIVNGKKIMK